MAFLPQSSGFGQVGQQVGQMGQQVGQMQVAHNLGMGQIWSDLIRNAIGSIIDEANREEQKRTQEKATQAQSTAAWGGLGMQAPLLGLFGYGMLK